MIIPFQSHDDLLADFDAARADPAALHVWWLGQSGFLVQYADRRLLFDPYLSDSLTHKYASTDKPHVRMTELAIDPWQLDNLDVVTSSHNHTDHLDADTLNPLLAVNPRLTVIVPAANRDFAAERLRVAPGRLTPIDDGQSVSVAGFTLHGVPAAHESLERDEFGRHRFLGYVVQCGPFTLYHSGDTVRFPGLAECLSEWPIDVAFLPINGRLPERRVAGNLWGREAVELARDAGMRCVVPCHYEMFEFNSVTTDEFVMAAKERGQNYRVLRCGERYSWRA